MDTVFQDHISTVYALCAISGLMLAQLLIADIIGIRRHHTPGSPVPPDHGDLHFRAARVVGNTNESIAIFLSGALFCIHVEASPNLTGYAAWLYVAARLIYAICYYMDLKLARSATFGVSLLALASLIGIGLFG